MWREKGEAYIHILDKYRLGEISEYNYEVINPSLARFFFLNVYLSASILYGNDFCKSIELVIEIKSFFCCNSTKLLERHFIYKRYIQKKSKK